MGIHFAERLGHNEGPLVLAAAPIVYSLTPLLTDGSVVLVLVDVFADWVFR